MAGADDFGPPAATVIDQQAERGVAKSARKDEYTLPAATCKTAAGARSRIMGNFCGCWQTAVHVDLNTRRQ